MLEAVREREQRMSTGIGQGIAIPHGKSPVVGELEVACGLAAAPIPYDALDGEPCTIFFLLVSPPEMSGPHIQALARISRMLAADRVRQAFAEAADASALLQIIRDEEARGTG
jgi:mannitol/fructose-specific phosphotransferase system IIA component (Ntr-type)